MKQVETGFAKDGANQAAYVKELRVMLMPDCGAWFAKSLDIDYEACGVSLEEVKNNFALGLAHTIHEHLRVYGDLKQLVVAAPQQVMDEYAKLSPAEMANQQILSLVTFMAQAAEKAHIAKPAAAAEVLPFDGIRFIQTTKKPVEHAVAA